MHDLVPTRGCCVTVAGREGIGQVLDVQTNDSGVFDARVQWAGDGSQAWVPVDKLSPGFTRGMDVQDVPRSRVRGTLGAGKVVVTRQIGHTYQVLVDFPEDGRQVWLPFQNLKRIAGPEHRFITGKFGAEGDAERFRLRNLSRAIEMWNENTGSLSHLDIDPLPHQIHLVHHILASGNLNWLIADDVGLGKTIEVGMLLSALNQRGNFKRVLIVTPAGLVKPWQEEMRFKFRMDDFRIYGRDFEINEPYQWKLYDRVIASLDRLKLEEHLNSVMQAEPWDLVIFDEAHRLSRRQWGQKFEAADRFKLAAAMRERTDSLLLLTATPHQGMQDKFQALLELIRPDLRPEIQTLTLNPEVLRGMVYRNQKAYVTDAEGNFIFKGKITRSIDVPQTEEESAFDEALRKYLREGYAAGHAKGRAGIAIGFVMTVYRKLAASSINAIHTALVRRLNRLKSELDTSRTTASSAEEDDRFAGEAEEMFEAVETSAAQFFLGEIEMLGALIAQSTALLGKDGKTTHFVEQLIREIVTPNPRERVVIFTEYRATQEHLSNVLEARFGADRVNVIHGGLNQDDRIAEIASFESTGQFLISTEAGGEGINLQRHCHIMVNFDLPWNPMRLVQRVGRLYRYGQENNVVVFNVHCAQSLDAEILKTMYVRLQQVVADMAHVSDEFNQGMEDEILGEVADLLDVERILENALSAGVSRTQQDIEAALEAARSASEVQRDLFKHFAGFDPDETPNELPITHQHVQSFVLGMFEILGIEIAERQFGGRVLNLRLPEYVSRDLHMTASRMRVTFDRELGQSRPDVEVIDLSSRLMRYLISTARQHEFGGLSAGIDLPDSKALVTAMLRWQNEQGRRMRQEFTAFRINEALEVDCNPSEFSTWLLQPAKDAPAKPMREETRTLRDRVYSSMDARFDEVRNVDLHPENRQWISGGWC